MCPTSHYRCHSIMAIVSSDIYSKKKKIFIMNSPLVVT